MTILLFSFLKIWHRRGCCERRLLFEEKRKYYQDLVAEMSEIVNEWNLQYGFFDDLDEARDWVVDK